MAPIISSYFHQLLHYFFPGHCFDELIVQFNYLHPKCAPILVSRLLGVAITLGSSCLLLPQILKIHTARSGSGISMFSQVLGLIAVAGSAAYSYEKKFIFGQWGDNLFVTIQTIVIIMQILYFAGAKGAAFAFMACCWSSAVAVAYHYIPMEVLSVVQTSTMPIVALSKGLQIYANYSQSGTGQLSTISVALQWLGCMARIFTSIQETGGDGLVIGPYIIAGLLNGTIFAQILYYNRQGGAVKVGGGKKKKTQ